MPIYRVEVEEVYYKVYEVEAEDEDSAAEKVYEGDDVIQVLENFDGFLKDSTVITLRRREPSL